jgi:RimJ/RimL family protein N-acetyltransferase
MTAPAVVPPILRSSFRLRASLPTGLRLRRFRLSDARSLKGVLTRNDDIRMFLGYPPVRSVEEAARFIRSIQRQETAVAARWWAIADHRSLVGAVFFVRLQLNPKRWERRTGMLGYWLDAPYRNKGVITAATRHVVAFAFSEWSLHKIKVGHVATNLASQAVIKKLGFRRVGVEKDEFHWHGRSMDHVVYEIVAARSGYGNPGSWGS